MIIIPDQPKEGINGYKGKDFERKEVLRREWKASITIFVTITASCRVNTFNNL